ncbi:MAG: sodium:calcium antiporter, partial [Candidatus Methylomirabilis sp.]|nr:sodium:calcium antiporter [Deltaproteobacteria bacterium]
RAEAEGRDAAGVLLFVAYTYYGYKASRAEKKEVQQEFAEYAAHASAGAASVPANLLLIAGGVAALGLGADWLIDGASGIARAAGVSERAIGLTLVAAGTSLPELATSVLAAIRGERDIAVANVIGSNVYNVLLILGVTGAISPLPASETILLHDFPWALGSAMVLIPFFMTGRRLDRLEGALLLLGYGVYVALLASGAAA